MIYKILSILFISVSLIFAETIIKEYTFGAPNEMVGNTYSKDCKILLPVNQQSKSVRVEYDNPVEIKSASIDSRFILDCNTVNNTSNTHVTQFLSGLPICLTSIHPVRYNTASKKLFYYNKVTVSIETEPVDPSRDVAPLVFTPFVRSKLQFTVDNPEAVAINPAII